MTPEIEAPEKRDGMKKLNIMIDKDSIRMQVARALRQAIISGELLPGQKLIEAELCEALEISRPSLREALRTLESERLVHFIPNRGSFVAELAWKDAEEIYATRMILEPEIAAQACKCKDEGLREQFSVALNQFASAVKSSDKLGQVLTTTQFYMALAEMAENRIVKDILDGLNARISVLRARSMSNPERSNHSLDEMLAIHQAVIAGNESEARSAAAIHIRNACEAARIAMTDSVR
ncbi:Transcriptional regulator, GntR family [Pantoea sp. AS-PWVM4]|uniref:GntR family transcriptional regulator n=1 Tax=Pantoea sp. AS-PWVM4 TaxID=1332069 RepID=UPI0003AC61FB|nr:GntR family transcriptional regulator [Pantoea sp. AS-PWVM4]ERK16286.1 Transcriptional regulator, GntR family [Pantoea sp. AS-PWVM4]